MEGMRRSNEWGGGGAVYNYDRGPIKGGRNIGGEPVVGMGGGGGGLLQALERGTKELKQ